MTISIKRIILFNTILLTTLSLKAQYEDRVITDKGDTIKCKLSHSMMGAYKYKTPNGTTVDLNMQNTREYYTENKKTWIRRLYITSSRIPCFLEIVTIGKLNLYEMSYKDMYYDGYLTYSHTTTSMVSGRPYSKTQYFVAKSDTAEVVFDDDLSKGKIKDLMDEKLTPFIQDNPRVLTLYKSENHVSADELKKLVEMYNAGR